jgi:hypothetical protein
MSTRNLPGGKGQPALKADNLTGICEPIVWKMWEPDVSQPYGPSWPVTGIALPFYLPPPPPPPPPPLLLLLIIVNTDRD